MVDFARIMADKIAAMTPDERAAYDIREAKRVAEEATEMEIPAVFERLELRRKFVPGSIIASLSRPQKASDTESYVAKTWEKPVKLRIETRGDDADQREVLQVVGAVTGYEAFTLNQEMVDMLQDPEERTARPRFYVCAGTAGRWDACSIDIDDVLGYLRDRRPGLFEQAPAP